MLFSLARCHTHIPKESDLILKFLSTINVNQFCSLLYLGSYVSHHFCTEADHVLDFLCDKFTGFKNGVIASLKQGYE